MKSFFKIILLAVIDAVTLYLSYYVSYLLVLQLMGMQGTDIFISNAYIFIPVKLIVYVIFFMYSLNKYRSIFLDVLGIIAANAVSIFAAVYLNQLELMDNIPYFVIVFVFDAIIAVMVRYLIRTSNNEYDDEDDYEESYQNKPEQNNTNFQNSIFDANNFQPEQQPPVQTAPVVTMPDPKILEEQREKDRKIDMLTAQLDDKEQRIQILENKITMQSNMAYQNYSTSENYIDNNKKEILDKILDDIKSLYSTLNSRAKLVEEREYNLLLKMVELEEKQRALDLIQKQNRDDFPERSGKYQRKRTHNATFPTPLALPRDNPNLANNIMKTLEILNTPSATAPIVLAAQANDEAPSSAIAKQQSMQNTEIHPKTENLSAAAQNAKPANIPSMQQPVTKIDAPAVSPAKKVDTVVQPPTKAREAEMMKPQGMQIAKPLAQETKHQNIKITPKQTIDFNMIKTNKIDIKAEELDQISSLIDIL